MLPTSLTTLLALPALLRVALAQQSNTTSSSTGNACNNSPALCSQPYSNISQLGAHDSPFLRDASTDFSMSGNQFYDTPTQLSAGVRLVSAQVQRANGSSDSALHVCHSSCDLLDAGSLSSWLGEIKEWMDANPNEVVTVLLVNGAEAPAAEIAAHYSAAGITTSLAYVPRGDSYQDQQWPTLQNLISSGTRLINFVSGLDADTAYPYLLDQFAYIFENDYENTSPTDFSCEPARPGAAVGSTAQVVEAGMMPLMNHFLYQSQAFGIQSPNESYVETTNAPSGGVGNLGDAASECTRYYGRAPAVVMVDFFNVGPAIETVDRLNGVREPVGRRMVSQSAPQESGAAAAAAVGNKIMPLVLAGLVASAWSML